MLVINGFNFAKLISISVTSIHRQNVLRFTYLHLIFPPRFTEEVHWSHQREQQGKASSSSIRKDGVKCCTLSGRGKSAKLRLSNKEKTGKKAKSFYGKIVLHQKFTL